MTREAAKIRAAAVQLNSTADRDRNLEVAERLVRSAASDGAELIVLPEKWTVLGGPQDLIAGAEPLDGPALSAARAWASELGVAIVAGSIAERADGDDALRNTCVMIDRDGDDVAVYRKVHMFDVDVAGVSYRESELERAGDEVVTGELSFPALAEPLQVGLSICYDLRFPELYRILAVRGARVLTVPAAFTVPTGRAHWEVLVRARAIENQCFVAAAGQIGKAPPHYDSFGHSMLVDPWGEVLAMAPDEECFVAADIDLERQAEVRATLPSLASRVPEAYVWPQEVLH